MHRAQFVHTEDEAEEGRVMGILKRKDDWCEDRRLELYEIDPLTVAAYVEQLGSRTAKPTVKQHLAAIRQLFAYLTSGGILETNPAASVRGPKYVVTRAKRRRWQPRRRASVPHEQAPAAALPYSICCHTFRATGVTTYLENGGTLEHAQTIASSTTVTERNSPRMR